jgi:uncharacterized protein YjhX (UPF0386 family)
MIHLIRVDRDGIMAFACDTIELFTEQGATLEVFRHVQATELVEDLCPYCVKSLPIKNSKVARPR